jgi:hypothetical protein
MHALHESIANSLLTLETEWPVCEKNTFDGGHSLVVRLQLPDWWPRTLEPSVEHAKYARSYHMLLTLTQTFPK